MRMVPMCTSRGRSHAVGECLTGLNGTLGDERNAVHPNVMVLSESMPVYGYGLEIQSIVDAHYNLEERNGVEILPA